MGESLLAPTSAFSELAGLFAELFPKLRASRYLTAEILLLSWVKI
jgi:hypothetical protein